MRFLHLSLSGSTAGHIVCTCWNSPSLFVSARMLWLWAPWGMIGSERKSLIKLFLSFSWNFSVPTQHYIVKKNSPVFGEAFLLPLKKTGEQKDAFKKRLTMHSWCFHSSSASLTWKRSWTKKLLTNISTGFQVSSYDGYPKNWSIWKYIFNRNPSFTLALQYDSQSVCLFPKYTLVLQNTKITKQGFWNFLCSYILFFLE